MLRTVLVALCAAVAFGWSTAAMHSSASRTPSRVTGLLPLVRHLADQRRWLSGMAASLLGLGLHSAALRFGSLAVVQPVVVLGLVFTFLFRGVLEHALPAAGVVLWSSVTAAGLATFLVAARTTTGAARPHGAVALVVLAAGGCAFAACLLGSQHRLGASRGVLLGAAGGIVFGLIAGTLKAVAAAADVRQAVESWPLYALVLLGVTGFLVNQTAYRRAPLTTSVPVLNVVNPVVALLYGAAAFGERPEGGAASLGVEAASLLVVLLSVFKLGRAGETNGTGVTPRSATRSLPA